MPKSKQRKNHKKKALQRKIRIHDFRRAVQNTYMKAYSSKRLNVIESKEQKDGVSD